MGAIETAISEGFSLVRDFVRAFSIERMCARWRSWTVSEWVSAYEAIRLFGNEGLVKALAQAAHKMDLLRTTLISFDEPDKRRARDEEYLSTANQVRNSNDVLR